MIHKIDDKETTDNPRMFAALRILEHVTPPLRYGHPPYWRAPVSDASKKAFIPSWNWTAHHHELPEDDSPITCDYNGAFLAAIGSVEIAHSQLKHIGQPLDPWDLDPRKLPVGYYLIDVFHWGLDSTIVSPLGTSELLKTTPQVWVSHPTLILLLELLQEGALGELVISDAWITSNKTSFRGPKGDPASGWIYRLKQARNGLLDNIAKADTPEDIEAARARYNAFKEGYGSALSMMLTGKICKTHRPEWPHAVYAQHAATSWRKAWRFSLVGPILAMGNTDELTVLRKDLQTAITKDKPPVRWDPSGRMLGYLKEKEKETEQRDQEQHDTHPEDMDFVMSDTFEDVL